MNRWEYLRTSLMSDDDMDERGRQGWELVAVVQPIKGLHMLDTAPGAIMFWKRPSEVTAGGAE